MILSLKYLFRFGVESRKNLTAWNLFIYTRMYAERELKLISAHEIRINLDFITKHFFERQPLM